MRNSFKILVSICVAESWSRGRGRLNLTNLIPIHMTAYLLIRNVHMCTCNVHVGNELAGIYQCVYVHVCMCVHVCMHVYMYVSVCEYVCLYVCIYVCMNVCMNVCTYVYTYQSVLSIPK